MDPSTPNRPPRQELNDHDRLAQYVERFFQLHDRTEWPTVRRAARSLGWRQSRVEDATEGDPDSRTFLSSYHDPSLGDHFVEAV